MRKDWKHALAGFAIVTLAAVAIWFSWAILRPNPDDAVPRGETPVAPLDGDAADMAANDVLRNPNDTVFPAESGDGIHHARDNHSHGEIVDVQVVRSASELTARVTAFEEGFRSIYRDDTADERRRRVAEVVAPDQLQYLNFEVSDVFANGTKNFDTVAVVENAEAIIGGLTSQLATGRVDLVIDVTYSHHYDDGEVHILGTLSKRSRWELTEQGWLLVGADPT